MTPTVIRGDARHLPLPDASVDLICTSPPYFCLRDYRDNNESMAGQIGSEATPQEYIAALVECTREWVRVLKPSGSIWINLGDKYAGSAAGGTQNGACGKRGTDGDRKRGRVRTAPGVLPVTTIRDKSLMLLPERYRIACVDQLGLIARAVVIWSKPNGLPESVTDRVRRSHEDWVCIRKMWPDEPCPPDVVEAVLRAVARHEISVEDGAAILSGELIPAEGFVHLVKQPRYYSAVDEIREPHSPHSLRYYGPGVRSEPRGGKNGQRRDDGVWHGDPGGSGLNAVSALGKLPGSVWEIPTEPLQVPEHLGVDHFAAFPTEWPRRIIAGWSPSGICTVCGEGRRPVASKTVTSSQRTTENRSSMSRGTANLRGIGRKDLEVIPRTFDVTITGEACACTPLRPVESREHDYETDEWVTRTIYVPDTSAPLPPTRPALVLDPFVGTGTTVLVAQALGRLGVGVDKSADYCRLARWRVNDPGQRAKAMRVEKPPLERVGQLDLFGEVVS
jgi:DNA modification methylase